MATKRKNTTNCLRRFFVKYKIISILILIIMFVSTLFIVKETQFYQSFSASASVGQATLFIKPDSSTLPPQAIIDVWVTVDQPIAFSHIELNFNPNEILLTEEPYLLASPLTRIISSTSMSESNVTGKITFVLGLEPSAIDNPPTNTFKLASLRFDATTPTHLESAITFDTNHTQLVGIDTTPFGLTFRNSLLTLNPTPTPVPTSTPTPTPPTPTQQQDIITINEASIIGFKKLSRLTVTAISTMDPNADLEVSGFGSLKYSKKNRNYYNKFWVIGDVPSTITVTSSYGGIATYPIPSQ